MGTHACRCDFIRKRLFKQGEQINGDEYLKYNSHVLDNNCA